MFNIKTILVSIVGVVAFIITTFFAGKKNGKRKEQIKDIKKRNKQLKKNINDAIKSKKRAIKNSKLSSNAQLERMRKRRKKSSSD